MTLAQALTIIEGVKTTMELYNDNQKLLGNDVDNIPIIALEKVLLAARDHNTRVNMDKITNLMTKED